MTVMTSQHEKEYLDRAVREYAPLISTTNWFAHWAWAITLHYLPPPGYLENKNSSGEC